MDLIAHGQQSTRDLVRTRVICPDALAVAVPGIVRMAASHESPWSAACDVSGIITIITIILGSLSIFQSHNMTRRARRLGIYLLFESGNLL